MLDRLTQTEILMTEVMEKKKALTPTQRLLVRSSAELRGWADCILADLECEGDCNPCDGRWELVEVLKRISGELWRLAD